MVGLKLHDGPIQHIMKDANEIVAGGCWIYERYSKWRSCGLCCLEWL